jgi:hypothetical protein
MTGKEKYFRGDFINEGKSKIFPRHIMHRFGRQQDKNKTGQVQNFLY